MVNGCRTAGGLVRDCEGDIDADHDLNPLWVVSGRIHQIEQMGLPNLQSGLSVTLTYGGAVVKQLPYSQIRELKDALPILISLVLNNHTSLPSWVNWQQHFSQNRWQYRHLR